MHANARGGCTDTVRDSGRKTPCRTGDSNPRQYRAWLSSRSLYPLSHPGPLSLGFRQRINVCGGGPFHRLSVEIECLWDRPVPQAGDRMNVCGGGQFHRLVTENECLCGRPVPEAHGRAEAGVKVDVSFARYVSLCQRPSAGFRSTRPLITWRIKVALLTVLKESMQRSHRPVQQQLSEGARDRDRGGSS